MTLTLSSADQGSTPSTAEELTSITGNFGVVTSFGTGTFSNMEDTDWWKVSLDGGVPAQITLSTQGAPSYTEAYLKLRGYAGQFIDGKTASGKNDVIFKTTPISAGDFFIEVGVDQFYGDPLNYNVSVEKYGQPAPQPTEEVPAPPVETEGEKDTPVPADETNDSGTTIIIEGDNQGDIIVGDNNTNGDNNNVGDGNTNNGVKVTEGRRWDKLDGNDADNIIRHAEGSDRMRMTGYEGADTFVLGDYTRRRALSTKVLDFGNDDIIGFDLTSLGLSDASVTEVSNRSEFRQAAKADFSIIMWNNSFYNDLNGEIRGLGGGERFAKVQGEVVSLTDLVLTEI